MAIFLKWIGQEWSFALFQNYNSNAQKILQALFLEFT